MSQHSTSAAPAQTNLTRTFEDERYGWTRTRRVRRRLAGVEAALMVVLVTATLIAASTDGGPGIAFFVVWTVGMLAFIPPHSLLNLGIRGLLDRSGRSLDEHQQHTRQRSYLAVRWPSTALNLAAWAGAVALVALTTHTMLGLCLGFVLWFASHLLAYWHLAWTLPNEDMPTLADS